MAKGLQFLSESCFLCSEPKELTKHFKGSRVGFGVSIAVRV